MAGGWVYILTNRPRGTLYIGVTSALEARMWHHRNGDPRGSQFAQKYRLRRLVLVEDFTSITDAIAREKQLKEWPRNWKLRLVERSNPAWRDLLPPGDGARP
jgi:putative endonuclease